MSKHSQFQNWFDDVPLCPSCDVGTQSKTIYKSDNTTEVVASEDRHFGFVGPDESFLYAVIDGHNGTQVADFTQQNLPVELILEDHLKDDSKEEDVIKKLKEAFKNISKGYVSNVISESLCNRANLQEQIPKDMHPVEALKRYPSHFESLEKYEENISGGCTATVALIHKDQLFVANVGDVRALLCRQDERTNDLIVTQLTMDHTTETKAELERFVKLGLENEIELLQVSKFLKTTRSIGDWKLQKEFKEYEYLRNATSEPIICIPSVHGGEHITTPMKFLAIMSHGFYKSFEEVHFGERKDKEQMNGEMCAMIDRELYKQGCLKGVAQRVVDDVCLLHENLFKGSKKVREDMTLLIRLFNYEFKRISPEREDKPVPSFRKNEEKRKSNLPPLIMPPREKSTSPATTSPANSTRMYATPTSPANSTPTSTDSGTPTTDSILDERKFHIPQPIDLTQLSPTRISIEKQDLFNRKLFSDSAEAANNESAHKPLQIDKEGKIKPYVDFSDFFQKMNELGGEKVVFNEFL